jgi:hypothetical protein
MSTDRRLRLWELVVEHACGKPVTTEHVCAVMVSAVRVDGVAVTVTPSAQDRETLYASDPVASDLADLILTLGEGPSVGTGAGGPTLVADLTTVESSARWPIFAPAAVALGARAIFALPLQAGGIRLGVVDLYRGRPGPLSGEQVADGLTLADVACALLIDSAQAWPERQREPSPTLWCRRRATRAGWPAASGGTPGDRDDHRSARGDRGGGPGAASRLCLCQRPPPA